MATPAFRRALASLPSWPAPMIALALMVGVGGYYYTGIHAHCTALSEDRDRLAAAVREAADSGRPLDLGTTLPFEWDSVQIAQDYRPSGRPLDCPFGWGMSREERVRLIRDGRYTLLALARKGEEGRAVEFPGDMAVFEGRAADRMPIPRDEAVFAVDGSAGDGRLRLRLAESQAALE